MATEINSLVVEIGGKEVFRIAKDGDVFVEGVLMSKDVELAEAVWNVHEAKIPENTSGEELKSITALKYSK